MKSISQYLKEGNMVNWLYRYIFRGIGILMLIGMITFAYLAIRSQMRASQAPVVPPIHFQNK